VQRALVDAACVQCGYCTPAVALAIHELLGRAKAGERTTEPSREEIADALSGTMCRCTGYEQFFDAVRIAAGEPRRPRRTPRAQGPKFRPELRHIGKDREKVDAARLALGERAFVEDRVDADACSLAHAREPPRPCLDRDPSIRPRRRLCPASSPCSPTSIAPTRSTRPRARAIPEPSPYDQRMFSKKVRHVGDRVAAVLAETLEEAQAALAAIKVEYEVLKPVLSIAQARGDGCARSSTRAR
jgi:putative selenate reductase molybdopterin-binding subunit